MTDRQCPSCGGFCKKECERADVMATDEVLRLELMQEEIDDLKNQLELLAKETVYRGNSVAYIYTKMVSYKKAIGDIWKILNENGIHENGKTPITEALRQALAHPEQEPVGWLVIGNAWDIFTDKAEAYRYALTIDGEVAPVYTASQSTKAAPTKAKEKT